jgi:hypothetical protein
MEKAGAHFSVTTTWAEPLTSPLSSSTANVTDWPASTVHRQTALVSWVLRAMTASGSASSWPPGKTRTE